MLSKIVGEIREGLMKTKADTNLYQCNPSTLKNTHTTCLPTEMLERLRTTWNQQFPKHAIPATITKKEELWRELRQRLKTQYQCTSEYCAVQRLDLPTVDKSTAARYFRPAQPTTWKRNPTDWHDTLSISRVMEQYEDAHPQFEFIGPVPIDFDKQEWGRCVVSELCRLDLSELKRQGTHYVGIIFNLDPHDRPGSHWVCAFIDIMNSTAYYYDSYGVRPPAEIRSLLQRCRDQGISHIYWNDIRHQRKESECGTYCMYVVISLLQRRAFVDICRNRVDDDTMNAFRDLLYATEKPRAEATPLVKLG